MLLFVLWVTDLALTVAMPHAEPYTGQRNVCPSFMPNCECSTMARGILVSCRDFTDRTQLKSTLDGLRGYDLHQFTMVNFSLELENGDFSDFNLYNLNVMSSHLTIKSIHESFLLETDNTLQALKFHNSILDFGEPVSSEAELSMLWFDRCVLEHHREEWIERLSVVWLRIEDCKQMTHFTAHPMRKLSKYTHVRSNLTNLRRSMLPANASSLKELDFSSNMITSLSDDLLSGLTSLEKLDLSNNQLDTLNETTFRDFDGVLVLSNNPLKCSSNLLWLAKRLNKESLLEPFRLICHDEDGNRKGIRYLNTTRSFVNSTVELTNSTQTVLK